MEMNLDRGDMYLADLSPANIASSVGCHQLVYYAKDKAGNVSLPVEKFVNVVSDESLSSDSKPNAPVFTLSIEGCTVIISWNNVPGATGYTLFYAPVPDAEYIGHADMGMERSITFDGSGMAFYAAVKACNDEGCSDFSNIEYFDLK